MSQSPVEPPPVNVTSPLVRGRTRSLTRLITARQEVKEENRRPSLAAGGAGSPPDSDSPPSSPLSSSPSSSTLPLPPPSPPSSPPLPSSPASLSRSMRASIPPGQSSFNSSSVSNGRGGGEQGGGRGVGSQGNHTYFQKNWGRAKILQLTETNYDAWELSLRNVFYANDWDELMDAAEKGYKANVVVEMRKAAWGCVTSSLSYDMSSLTSSIPLGNVEELVRTVFDYHFRNSASTRGALKDKRHHQKLEDWKSFEAYVAGMKTVLRRLASVQYVVSDEDKIHYLLKGLPSDYDALKQTIRCCQSRGGTTFEMAIADIRTFCQDNPKVFGSGVATTKRSDTVMVQNDSANKFRKSKGVCKLFAAGKTCPYKPCKFKHEKKGQASKSSSTSDSSQVPMCTYCGKGRHPVAKCWKKKKEAKGSEKESVSAVCEADGSEEEAWVTVDYVSDEVFAVQAQSCDPLWLVDGGSTCHVTPNSDGMFNIRSANITIKVGGGRCYECTQIGDVRVRTNKDRTFVLKDVRLCSDFQRSILSEAPFIDKGCAVLKVHNELTIVTKAGKGHLVLSGFRDLKKLFQVSLERVLSCAKQDKVEAVASVHTLDVRDSPLSLDKNWPHARPLNDEDLGNCGNKMNAQSQNFQPKDENVEDVFMGEEDLLAHKDEKHVENFSSSHPSHKNFQPEDENVEDVFMGAEDLLALKDEKHVEIFSSSHPSHKIFEHKAVENYDVRRDCGLLGDVVCASSDVKRSLVRLWHNRLGHRNVRSVCELLGVPIPKGKCFCASCAQGKAQRHPRGNGKQGELIFSGDRPASCLHTDAAGPFRIPTRSGKKYFVVIVCANTRYVHVFLLSSLGQFLGDFKLFVAALEAQFGKERVVSLLVADGGKYYTSNALSDFCQKRGIRQAFSPPATPELNGLAERYIRTLKEMVRTMLIAANAPTFLWGECLLYSVYIVNRLPRRYKVGDDKKSTVAVPINLWRGRVMREAHSSIRVWGCAAYPLSVGALNKTDDTLGVKASMHVFLGVDEQYNCYRLGTLPHYKIVLSANVSFDEETFPCTLGPEEKGRLAKPFSHASSSQESDGDAVILPSKEMSARPVEEQDILRRSARGWKPSEKALNNIADQALNLNEGVSESINSQKVSDPKTQKQAYESVYSDEWKEAEAAELQAIRERGVYRLVKRPEGVKVVGARFHYKIKWSRRNPTEVDRWKVRYLVQGYAMRKGIDFDETFAPTALGISVKMFLYLTHALKMTLCVVDISNFFLYGKQEKPLYCEQPRGYEEKPRESWVWLLVGSLYGTPNAPRQASKELLDMMSATGFKPLAGDTRWFLKKVDAQSFAMCVVHVDDIALASVNVELRDEILKRWKAFFKLKVDLSPVSYLNIQMKKLEQGKTLVLSQDNDVEEYVSLRRMTDCSVEKKKVSTPLPFGFVYKKRGELEGRGHNHAYLRACGKLIWLLKTRFDAAYAINCLCRNMSNSTEDDDKMANWVARYFRGKLKFGLRYVSLPSPLNITLCGFVDASFVDGSKSRSTGSWLLAFGDRYQIGGVVAGKTFVQRLVYVGGRVLQLVRIGERSGLGARIVGVVGIGPEGADHYLY